MKKAIAFQCTYDPSVGCGYIYFGHSERKVKRTVESEDVNIDYDADGKICGVEFLGALPEFFRAMDDGCCKHGVPDSCEACHLERFGE